MIRFLVPGVPAQQGSKRHVGNGRMIESNKERLMPWRASVTAASADAMDGAEPTTKPVHVTVEFRFMRPKAHYTRGGDVRLTAPRWKDTVPDIDKLLRALLDGMTGVVFQDDKQVVKVEASKRYSGAPGAYVRVDALVNGAVL